MHTANVVVADEMIVFVPEPTVTIDPSRNSRLDVTVRVAADVKVNVCPDNTSIAAMEEPLTTVEDVVTRSDMPAGNATPPAGNVTL